MDTIGFDLLLPHWKVDEKYNEKEYMDEPWLIIKINNVDILSNEEFYNSYEGVSVRTFLCNEDENNLIKADDKQLFNGMNLIGVCSDCRWDGCDDLFIEIETNNKRVKWTIIPDRIKDWRKTFEFSIEEYKKQLDLLKEKYFSYSWEGLPHKIRRLCDNLIQNYTTKTGKHIEGIRIHQGKDENTLDNKITIIYYDDFKPMRNGIVRRQREFVINWNGKTLEDALKQLKEYADENLEFHKDIINIIKENNDKNMQILYKNVNGLKDYLDTINKRPPSVAGTP